MQSTILSLSARLWLEQLRREAPGPFAVLRNHLPDEVGESSPSAEPLAPDAIEPTLIKAFDAGYRGDVLAAEDALAALIHHPPSESLTRALITACETVRSALGSRCRAHGYGRTLSIIH